MALNAQPRPWTVTAGREIADADGNVVQYTIANLGQICLAANAYERLIGALSAVDDWFGADPATRGSESDMREAVKQAIGRIGCEQIAAMVEGLREPSNEVERRIAGELSIPEAAYTSSEGVAMSLIPKGCSFGVEQKDQLDIATNEMVRVYIVDVRLADGRAVRGTSSDFARGVTAAAMRAQDLSRAG